MRCVNAYVVVCGDLKSLTCNCILSHTGPRLRSIALVCIHADSSWHLHKLMELSALVGVRGAVPVTFNLDTMAPPSASAIQRGPSSLLLRAIIASICIHSMCRSRVC